MIVYLMKTCFIQFLPVILILILILTVILPVTETFFSFWVLQKKKIHTGLCLQVLTSAFA